MPFPAITHAMCRVELSAIIAETVPDAAEIIRNAAPDPGECPPAWITDELVATAVNSAINSWFGAGQVLPGFPQQHSPVWTNAYFI